MYTKFLMLLLLSTLLYAQDKDENKILEFRYKRTVDVQGNPLDNDANANVPKALKLSLRKELAKPKYFILKTNKKESVWSREEKLDNNQNRSAVKVVSWGTYNLYKDLNESKYLIERNLYNDIVFIADSLKTYNWKLTREKKTSLGYELRKATTQINDSIKVVAWYAPKLNYCNGPDHFGGLPGLIFEIYKPSKLGFINLQLSKITILSDKKGIQKPVNKNPIRPEEFKAMEENRNNKMREIYSRSIELKD